MKIIFDYNRTIYNPETASLYEGVLDLLANLSKKHKLILVSKKEPGRDKNIETLGLKTFFEEILFVEEKTTALFKKFADKNTPCLVVGDRIKSEILVGNMCGFITIWLKQGSFSNETPSAPEEEPKHTINNITEFKSIVDIYEE